MLPGTHWIGGWVDPRAGLENVEKRKFLTLPGLELRLLGRPVRSQSLYRLRYPDLNCTCGNISAIFCTQLNFSSIEHIMMEIPGPSVIF
jgi:hypothetical protein